MISALVFDQLLLVALVCICLFHLWWPDGRAANSQKPLKPPKKCSKAPKLFAGLLHKPRCEACGHGVNTRPKAPDTSPPLLRFTRGRRRTIDPWNHFCPDQACSYYGWLGRGNIRSNGHPGGKPWRQCQCVSCHGYFQQTYGTPFHGKRGSPDMLVWAVGALCEGLGIRAVARVFEVAPNTVLAWFVAAADQLKAFSQQFLHDLQGDQVQLDALFALLSAVQAGEVREAKAIKQLSRSPHWVWVAMAPVTKLILIIDVGERTLAMAQRVVHQLVQALAPDRLPLFRTDGYKDSFTAILSHFGMWVPPERQRAHGAAPKPRWMPRPGLLQAQVIKTVRRRRLVRRSHRVMFGTLAAVNAGLAKRGWQINTSFGERLNLDFRQPVAAIGRRVNTLCKHEAGLRQQLALCHTYANVCLPHGALRVPLATPEATNGTGSARQWRPYMPAMAAGLTDRVWTLRAVRMFRVPPWPQSQAL